jgi:hypothetical protein
MVIDEAQRRALHQRLVEVLGVAEADLLMEHLPPSGWGDVARRSDLDQLERVLRLDMDVRESRLRADLERIRGELRAEMGELRGEMGALRGEVGMAAAKQMRVVVLGVAAMVLTSVGTTVSLAVH